MSGLTIYEFDVLAAACSNIPLADGLHPVPRHVFRWLEAQSLLASEEGGGGWLRMSQRRGRRVVQVTGFVGVIRAPDGYQIEVLPKIGKATDKDNRARQLLIEMLCCLHEFRHVQIGSARLQAARMPLYEVFIAEFLSSMLYLVKRGLRSEYVAQEENLFALKGKLLIAQHFRTNLCRADRFFTNSDEFSTNRPENRLLHAALQRVLLLTTSNANQKLARELAFVFADVPASIQVRIDFQKARTGRSMSHYAEAMAWSKLILEETSPLAASGCHRAPSLLFPMESLFEAFVAQHLARQLSRPLTIKMQVRDHHLAVHRDQRWFQLRPDVLVKDGVRNLLVLDTKWKLLDSVNSSGKVKYGLSQSDFYQMLAYGQSYLDGQGDVILIYPRTDVFDKPLPVFHFPKHEGLRVWVLPFCLESHQLLMPAGHLSAIFPLLHP